MQVFALHKANEFSDNRFFGQIYANLDKFAKFGLFCTILPELDRKIIFRKNWNRYSHLLNPYFQKLDIFNKTFVAREIIQSQTVDNWAYRQLSIIGYKP